MRPSLLEPTILLLVPVSGAPGAWRTRIDTLSLPLILACALLAFAWLLPGHYLPWMMFQQETLAALAGLLLCWAAVEKSPCIVWPLPAWAAVAVAVVPWLQWAAGQIRYLTDALLSSAYLGALGMSIAAAATLAAGPRRGQLLDGFAAACVAAAIVSTGMALYQWLELPAIEDWIAIVYQGRRAFANLSQPNQLATLLALGATGLLRWYEARRIGGAVAALALLWLGWGIVMTQSRTGWMFVAMLAIGWVLLHRRARLRTSGWAVAVGVVVFAALVWLNGPLQNLWALDPGAAAAASAVRTEAGPRPLIWRVLIEAAWQSPWFGYGWNQVVQAFYDTAGHMPASHTLPMHSHNLMLDLIIYNGIPLGVLLCLALAGWVLRTLWRCRDADSWCLILALLALLAHAMVEYPLHYLYFLLPAGLLVGALEVMTAPAGASLSRMPQAPRLTLWLPALLMAGLVTWVGVEYLRAEEALRRLRFASARIGITMADLRPVELRLLDGWQAYYEASRLPLRQDMSEAELTLLADTTRRFPYPAALYRYARALVLNGRDLEARVVLQHACKGYYGPVQVALRESWQEQQANDPVLRRVDFPACRE